jgi:hypothetical protein
MCKRRAVPFHGLCHQIHFSWYLEELFLCGVRFSYVDRPHMLEGPLFGSDALIIVSIIDIN